jgi:hypothetical protein
VAPYADLSKVSKKMLLLKFQIGGPQFAALVRTKGWAVIAMGIVAVGDTELCFDMIDSLLEHSALHGGNVMVEAKRPTDNAGQVDNYASIAVLCIIQEFEMSKLQEAAVYLYWRILIPMGLRGDWAVGLPKLPLLSEFESSTA